MAKCNRCLDEGTLYNGESADRELQCPDCRGIDTSSQDAEYAAWMDWQPESTPDKRDAHAHGFDAGVQFASRHPHQDIEPEQRWKLKRAKSRNRDHKRRRAAERRAETAEAEIERLREALREAVHRMASVVGRLRVRGLCPGDGNYLAELLPKWRELAAAASPDTTTQLGSEQSAPNTTAEKLGPASPDDRGGER